MLVHMPVLHTGHLCGVGGVVAPFSVQSCCCWVAGGCGGLSSVKSTTAGCLVAIATERVRAKAEKTRMLGRIRRPEVQAGRGQ